MTPKQAKALEQLKEKILTSDSYGLPENYEYKEFEVKELEWGDVSLVTTVGRIGDEGTLASLIARNHRHIFIGPKGGLTLANPAKWVKGKKVPMRGWLKGYRAVWWPTF